MFVQAVICLWSGANLCAQDIPPHKILVTLPEAQDHVTHRVADGTYRVEVHVKRSLLQNPGLQVELSSRDQGTWKLQDFQVGELVTGKPDWNALEKTPPTPESPFKLELKLKFLPDPDAANKKYDKLIAPLEKMADRQASRRLDSQKWQAALNVLATAQAVKWMEEKEFDDWKVLTKPKFLSYNKVDPVGVIKNVAIWLALDELLHHFPVKIRPELPENDKLKLWNELIGVMFGTITNPQDLDVLASTEFERVRLAGQVEFRVGFEPSIDSKPDRRWSSAPKITLGAPTLHTANWEGIIGGSHRPVEWLAVQSSEGKPLEIEPLGDSKQYVWSEVQGEHGWKYLRVLPKNTKQPTEFKLRVLVGAEEDRSRIEIRTEPPVKVKFPF